MHCIPLVRSACNHPDCFKAPAAVCIYQITSPPQPVLSFVYFSYPILFATLVSQIVTLLIPNDDNVVLLCYSSVYVYGHDNTLMTSCRKPHRRARIPHKNKSPWIERSKSKMGSSCACSNCHGLERAVSQHSRQMAINPVVEMGLGMS